MAQTNSTTSMTSRMLIAGAIAIVMLIPLFLVRQVINEREDLQQESVREVAASWSRSQCLVGPQLLYQYDKTTTDKDGQKVTNTITRRIYPSKLNYDVDIKSQNLHRSIYDVTVYTSTIHIWGEMHMPTDLKDVNPSFLLSLSDLRGIEGEANVQFGDKKYEFVASQNDHQSITTTVTVDPSLLTADNRIPYDMTIRLKGSEAMTFRPVGNMTTVSMHSNCETPSFTGDFLPSERDVREDGFTAQWVVSQINRGAPEDTEFGVNLLQPMTQYQQTTRAAKYGLLIIALVFLAGFMVEFLTKKEINILQCVIIGLSLVLFYVLLLSFSEFLSFGLAYLVAMTMTTAALTGYYRGILRDKTAYMLGGFVALAYTACYMLIHLQKYALLAGSLLLFVCLLVLMYFTRNIGQKTES